MNSFKSLLCSALLIGFLSVTTLSKTGTISTTKSGTISTTGGSTVGRGGTISTTGTTRIQTINPVFLGRSRILEVLAAVLSLW